MSIQSVPERAPAAGAVRRARHTGAEAHTRGSGPAPGAGPPAETLQRFFAAIGAPAAAPPTARGRTTWATGLEAALRVLFVDSPLPMWVVDPAAGRFIALNRAAAALYGYTAEEFAGLPVSLVRTGAGEPPGRGRGGREAGAARAQRHRLRDGCEIEVEVSSSPVELAGCQVLLEWINNVTERNRLERELRDRSLRDPVTGGATRGLFLERVTHALARLRRREGGIAVLVADIDCFADVTQSLGYTGGDSLLQAVAARLAAAVRPGDTVARLAGDEFGILLEDVGEARQAADAARRLSERFVSPVETPAGPMSVELNIGIAVAALPDTDAEALVRNAALAMHAARAGGAGRVVPFSPGMDSSASERLTLAQHLRGAVAGAQLRVVFQPLVAVSGGTVVGCEALVRWEHPTRGLVPPDSFIPLAEETGEIRAIDTWVLRSACLQVAQWRREGLGDISVAVNCSGRNLGQGDLVERVAGAVRDSGLPPGGLEIEVTESVAAAQPAEALAELRELRRIGVAVAIDDFGTGYSSLSKLATFPVDRIKIDRAFVASIRQAGDDAPLVAAMVALAHRLGLTVTAEGVETPDQLRFLARNGCDVAQGYLLSPPVPAPRFRELLADGGRLVPPIG